MTNELGRSLRSTEFAMCLSTGFVQSYAKTKAPKCVTDRIIGCLIRSRKKYSEIVRRVVDLYYCLPTRDLRRLSYQCSVHYKFIFPQKWCETEMADTVRLNAFLKINFSLAIRRLETTSLARAMNLTVQMSIHFF
jgi:hypothetical protein